MTMHFGENIAAVQVHTPAEGVCVEPQTSWPDAFNLAARGVGRTGLATIAAGERFGAAVSWRWGAAQS